MGNVAETILHDYPYPIAKCYERLVRATDIQERWNSTRYLIEITLKFCACISVSRYLHNEIKDKKTDAALTCLDRPALGHWLNLLVRCATHNQKMEQAFLEEGIFAPTRERPLMAQAHSVMQQYPDREDQGTPKNITITRFFEGFVAYRNRSSGHGAPSREHIEEITPILEDAAIDLLTHLSLLKEIQLIFLNEIRLDRSSYVHSMLCLTGTSQIAMPDYVTSAENAFIGHDKKLFLTEPGSEVPIVTVHPLAIYSGDEVYLLHRSNLKRNVDYICHHTGEFYSADRIFEDFRNAFGAYIGGDDFDQSQFDPTDIYEQSLRMSLIDGVLSGSERSYLDELKSELGINAEDADDIERIVWAELSEKAATSAFQENQKISDVSSVGELEIQEGKRILFISYASVRTGFWADLVSRLAARIHQRGNIFSMVAPDPMNDYDASAMANLISDMEAIIASHSPDMILIVPFPSVSFTSLFENRFGRFSIPLITLDTEFVGVSSIQGQNLGTPHAIHVNNYRGGWIAAEKLLETSGKVSDEKLRLMVMPGLEGALHSSERVRGFSECLEKTAPNATVRVLPEGNFNREKAQRIFGDYLEDVDLSRYNGIFCCNDEMALGVYLAYCNWRDENEFDDKFYIIGFNNTAELKSVKDTDYYKVILGSIDQSLDDYVGQVLSTADKLLSGQSVAELSLIEPQFAT